VIAGGVQLSFIFLIGSFRLIFAFCFIVEKHFLNSILSVEFQRQTPTELTSHHDIGVRLALKTDRWSFSAKFALSSVQMVQRPFMHRPER